MSIRNIQQNATSQRHLNAPRPIIRVPSSSGFQSVGGIWQRDPSWLAMPSVSASEQKIVILTAVREQAEFVAFTISGAYTVDWGDGSAAQNYTSGSTAEYLYDYTDGDLAGTNGGVTFTDSGDLVNRTAHGYSNGDVVVFWSVTTTTGLTVGQPYYVINATTDTFQVAATAGGSAVVLTNDGSGSLLPYKQAVITITPQAGQNLTSVNLNVKHSTSGLQAYATGFLDVIISVPNATSLAFGGGTVVHSLVERVDIKTIGSVTNTQNMFSNCTSLQSVPLFDTSAVTVMLDMFSNCNTLQSVPLFDTSAVTNMVGMLNTCNSLQSVPLFDTSSVTNMQSMFQYCYSLQSVPLFDTSAVTNMQNMFYYCYSLQSVPLFDTSSVTNMSGMFTGCSSLQSVPLFDTSAVTSMLYMFQNCSSLQSVPLFDTSAVTNMLYMFLNCYSLQSVPLFDTSAVTNMQNMFYYCNSLQSVPLFDTSAVINMINMFSNCTSLQSVPLFDTSAVTNMSGMFQNCISLQSVPALDVSAVSSSANFASMFASCRSLMRIEASDFNYTFSVSGCKLGGAQLDEIYTNLPTVVGQTITVTNNYGTAGDDPTIATAKGWTVTG